MAGGWGGWRGGRARKINHRHIASSVHPHLQIKLCVWLAPSSWPQVPFMSLPGQRQYHLWEECPVAIASNNNAVHLQYPSPQPSPNLWPCCSQPTLRISTVGCYTSDLEKRAQRQVRHFRPCCLLPGQWLKCFPQTKWRDTECCIDLCSIDFPLVCDRGLLFRGEQRRGRMGCFYGRTLKPGKRYFKETNTLNYGKCTKLTQHWAQHIPLEFHKAMILLMEQWMHGFKK